MTASRRTDTSTIEFTNFIPLLALVMLAGCGGQQPMSPTEAPAAAALAANEIQASSSPAAASPRSGSLHVTKECSAYTGLAGSFCTIKSSSLKEIPAGSRVVYASAAGPSSLDSEIIVQAPGYSKAAAFGHVKLDFATGTGAVTLSGGTGKLEHLHASVAVRYLGGPNWAWDGTYCFSNGDDDSCGAGEED